MKNSIVTRIRLLTALSVIVLASAGFAHAGAVGAERSPKVEKTKKGTLKVAAVTNLGDLRLEPGEYEVKQVNSAAGTVIRFTRYTYDPYVEDGVSAHQWETLEAKVTIEALASEAKDTKLLLAWKGDKAIGLEIAGNSADYWF